MDHTFTNTLSKKATKIITVHWYKNKKYIKSRTFGRFL